MKLKTDKRLRLVYLKHVFKSARLLIGFNNKIFGFSFTVIDSDIEFHFCNFFINYEWSNLESNNGFGFGVDYIFGDGFNYHFVKTYLTF